MIASAPDSWASSSLMLFVVVPAAAIAARLLTWSVSSLIEPQRNEARICRLVEIVAVLVASALWWWEAVAKGPLPIGVMVSPQEVALRYASHVILFGFLAAAAWVDLRHRVIPDAITVPGVLVGLAWNSLFPFTLPPIATFVERSFAIPEVRSDALGMFGGIAATVPPPWLSSAAGVSVAMIFFAVWWWFGTSPDEAPPSSAPADQFCWRPSGSLSSGILGGVVIMGSWVAGGSHWAGLVASLAGLVVAGGLIWATRTGASWALGREAMGFGDVTLMAMAGAWLGWQSCVMACMIGVFIGLIHGVFQLLSRSETELPFGPSLCLGLVVVVIAWRSLWEWAGPQFEQPLELATVASLVIAMTALTLWAWSTFRGTPTRPAE